MTDANNVVIIGGGHNGLVCAAYLAKAGKKVTVLEAADQVGGAATLTAIPEPRNDYGTVKETVQAALRSEQEITALIHDLVSLADADKDYATRSFLNWFVDELVEEVSKMTDLLSLVDLAAGNMLQVENRVRHEMMAHTGS